MAENSKLDTIRALGPQLERFQRSRKGRFGRAVAAGLTGYSRGSRGLSPLGMTAEDRLRMRMEAINYLRMLEQKDVNLQVEEMKWTRQMQKHQTEENKALLALVQEGIKSSTTLTDSERGRAWNFHSERLEQAEAKQAADGFEKNSSLPIFGAGGRILSGDEKIAQKVKTYTQTDPTQVREPTFQQGGVIYLPGVGMVNTSGIPVTTRTHGGKVDRGQDFFTYLREDLTYFVNPGERALFLESLKNQTGFDVYENFGVSPETPGGGQLSPVMRLVIGEDAQGGQLISQDQIEGLLPGIVRAYEAKQGMQQTDLEQQELIQGDIEALQGIDMRESMHPASAWAYDALQRGWKQSKIPVGTTVSVRKGPTTSADQAAQEQLLIQAGVSTPATVTPTAPVPSPGAAEVSPTPVAEAAAPEATAAPAPAEAPGVVPTGGGIKTTSPVDAPGEDVTATSKEKLLEMIEQMDDPNPPPEVIQLRDDLFEDPTFLQGMKNIGITDKGVALKYFLQQHRYNTRQDKIESRNAMREAVLDDPYGHSPLQVLKAQIGEKWGRHHSRRQLRGAEKLPGNRAAWIVGGSGGVADTQPETEGESIKAPTTAEKMIQEGSDAQRATGLPPGALPSNIKKLSIEGKEHWAVQNAEGKVSLYDGAKTDRSPIGKYPSFEKLLAIEGVEEVSTEMPISPSTLEEDGGPDVPAEYVSPESGNIPTFPLYSQRIYPGQPPHALPLEIPEAPTSEGGADPKRYEETGETEPLIRTEAPIEETGGTPEQQKNAAVLKALREKHGGRPGEAEQEGQEMLLGEGVFDPPPEEPPPPTAESQAAAKEAAAKAEQDQRHRDEMKKKQMAAIEHVLERKRIASVGNSQ